MATLTAVILPHHRKKDVTWNVKIRITQQSRSVYIDTDVYAGKRDLDSKGKLKQIFIDRYLTETLNKFRCYLNDVDHKSWTAERIKEFIIKKQNTIKVQDIDFIGFCFDYVKKLESEGRYTSAIPLKTVSNSLKDYTKGMLSPDEITSRFLKRYEEYLRTERSLTRINQFGQPVVTVNKPLSDSGIFKHMANLRLLFNECKNRYNDEDAGLMVICNNPFAKYKIKPTRKEKIRNASIEDLVKVYLYDPDPDAPREELAKDMFLLSFFLCGMNSVDFYNYPLIPRKGRIEYNRSKTKSMRADGAFISIKVPEIAVDILKKYTEGFKSRFADARSFNKAINIGLKRIGEKLGFTASFYSARHTFATVARNDCRCSKDDVALALNHIDIENKVTDGYIAKDWGIVDEVQEKVLKLFLDKLDEIRNL